MTYATEAVCCNACCVCLQLRATHAAEQKYLQAGVAQSQLVMTQMTQEINVLRSLMSKAGLNVGAPASYRTSYAVLAPATTPTVSVALTPAVAATRRTASVARLQSPKLKRVKLESLDHT